MSGEAFQTVLTCDMRTAPDGRHAEYLPAGEGQPRWWDDDPATGGRVRNGWATCYLYAEHATRIAAQAVRDQEMTGETGDHPGKRSAAADLLDAAADTVRLLALDHAHDSHITDERWAERLDALQTALDTARAATVPAPAGRE